MKNKIKLIVISLYISVIGLSQTKQVIQKINYGSNIQTGKYIKIKSAKLYYETYGQGVPLLLIHGGYKSIVDFEYNIPALSEHFMVIAVDSRGYGRSTNNLDSMSYELLTDDMEQFITQLNIKSVNVCGFSDGGIVALYLAAKYPSLVRKVFVSGANYKVTANLSNKIDDKIIAQKINSGAFWSGIKNHYIQLNPNPEKYVRQFQLVYRMWCQNPCIPKDLFVKIDAPVFLLYGDRDIIPLELGLEMYHLLPQKTTQLCVLPNATHYTFSEKPKLVNDLLISFF